MRQSRPLLARLPSGISQGIFRFSFVTCRIHQFKLLRSPFYFPSLSMLKLLGGIYSTYIHVLCEGKAIPRRGIVQSVNDDAYLQIQQHPGIVTRERSLNDKSPLPFTLIVCSAIYFLICLTIDVRLCGEGRIWIARLRRYVTIHII